MLTVKCLQIGAYTYLAKWSPSDLQKPTDRHVTLCSLQVPAVTSIRMTIPCFCRNTGKIKDWIDAVYVKKRFYSAEAAASAAMHSPPPSQSHVSSVIDTLLCDLSLLLHLPFCLRHLYWLLLIKMLVVTAAQAEHQ